ncbi:hypothetical protein ACFL5O_11440, partial [Myxococcota bacterium]
MVTYAGVGGPDPGRFGLVTHWVEVEDVEANLILVQDPRTRQLRRFRGGHARDHVELRRQTLD